MTARALLLLVVLLPSCDKPPAAAPGANPTPASLGVEQFQTLRWLQGNWRGAEAGGAPFYESYVFLDDSTIRSFTYADSTFAQANDSGTVSWSGGQVRAMGGPAIWVVTRHDSAGTRFDPERGAGNSFEWIPGDHDHWTAVLTWPRGGDARGSRTYQMTRVGS